MTDDVGGTWKVAGTWTGSEAAPRFHSLIPYAAPEEPKEKAQGEAWRSPGERRFNNSKP